MLRIDWNLQQLLLYLQKLIQTLVTKTGVQTLTNKTMVGGTSSALYVTTDYDADGAITISKGIAAIAKTSAAAMTIAAPTTAQNGLVITILARTAFAHVITFTGGTFAKGAVASYTTVTMSGYIGASVRIIADNGVWVQSGVSSCTPS